METTIVIDDDIVAKLEGEMRQRDGATFKEIVNETLRLGLQAKQTSKPFKIRPHSMGKRENLNYDKINELLETIEQN
ncbi:MAG TPA: hypothetical protein VF596_12895 [Pyrinomonadaceae bacterium]